MTSSLADRGNVSSLPYWSVKSFEAKYGRPPSSPQDVNLALSLPDMESGYNNLVSALKSSGAYHSAPSSASTPAHASGAASGSGGDLMSLIHQAGFQGNAANTMYAIVMAESGGSATAHNTNSNTGDNSYGLAQINMLGSMGPARLREYGLSSNDQLFDPLTNLKVAYKMSGGGTHWGDWSTYNSGAYRQFLGQSGATVTSGGAGGAQQYAGMNGGSGSTQATADTFKAVDGLGNLLKSIPELQALVDKAVAGNWSTSTFQNNVENSAWWKTHSDTARSMIIQQANDPAAWHQSFQNAYSSAVSLSHQLGMSLSSSVLTAIVNNAMLTGNAGNQQWLTSQISNHENYSHLTNTSGLGGQMAATVLQLQQLGDDYGYHFGSPAMLAQHAQSIVGGQATIDTYKNTILNWAISAFPALAEQIKGGQTVAALASPYMQSMSNLLEVNPGTLNLWTPNIRQALQGTTDPTSKQRVATPLWQFEQQVRQDPRWQYTANARDTASTALVKIGHDFGFGF